MMKSLVSFFYVRDFSLDEKERVRLVVQSENFIMYRIVRGLHSLIFDARSTALVSTLLLLGEIVLTFAIIQYVPCK